MPRPPPEALVLTDMVDRVPGLKKVDEAPPKVCADDGRDPESSADSVIEACEESLSSFGRRRRLLTFDNCRGMLW